MWAGRSEKVGLGGPGRDRGTLVAAVTCPPGRLVAALVRHQLTRQDESAQARALGLLLAAHAVGLQQPGALQREVHTSPANTVFKKINIRYSIRGTRTTVQGNGKLVIDDGGGTRTKQGCGSGFADRIRIRNQGGQNNVFHDLLP